MVSEATALIVVVLVAASTCLAVATSAVLTAPVAPSAEGSIISTDELNIYSDQEKTSCCTHIDWGEIEQGTTAVYKIYIENQGSTAKTLHMSTSDWQPTGAGSCLTLNWDREAAVLEPGSVVEATFTLTAAWDIGSLDAFNFDITIQGIV